MSHISKISSIPITDLACLARVAETLGMELMRDQRAFRWYGRSVGDSPLPDGFSVADLGHCEHAIRVKGDARAYEIGVVKRRDGQPGYALLYDSWMGGFGLEKAAGVGLSKLLQGYSLEGVRKLYGRTHQFTMTEGKDGRLHVSLEG